MNISLELIIVFLHKDLPVTGFPLASVTPTDCAICVTGRPFASRKNHFLDPKVFMVKILKQCI